MLYQTPAKPYAASLPHEHEAKRNANEPYMIVNEYENRK